MSKRRAPLSDADKLYQMLQPKPKFLISRSRQLVRHGELVYFSINTMSKKPRYFWLFNDCLLITKRLGVQRFQLQIVVHFSPGIKVITMPESPNYEFRLLCPEKGSLAKAKQRRIVMWGKNREHKELWLKDLKHCLWKSSGMTGPDPAQTPQHHDTHSAHDDDEELRNMMKEVSIRDKRQGTGRENDRVTAGGGSRNPSSSSSQRTSQTGGARAGMRQPQEIDDDDDYENDDSGDEAEGEQWAKDTGDPLISFDDDFSGQSSYDPYAAQRSAAPQVPAGVALSGTHQQQAFGYTNTPGQAYSGAYGYGHAYLGAAHPGGGMVAYNPYAAAASSNQPLSYHAYSPYPQATYGHYAAGQAAPSAGIPMMADASAYYQPLHGNAAAASLYAQQGLMSSPAQGNAKSLYSMGSGAGWNGSVGQAPSASEQEGNQAGDYGEDFARRELMEAAKAVEDLAIDFAASRPPTSGNAQVLIRPAAGQVVSFDDVSEAIYEGAQAMARASTILLSAATRAQSERGRSGSDASGTYHADPQWTEGLVSAARYVVAATQNLIITASQYVESKGEIGDEHLVASAGGVSAATAQLLAAFRARSQGKGNDVGLEEAAKAINGAKQKLVEAARAATAQIGGGRMEAPSPVVDPSSKYSLTARQVNEIEAQARIIKLEKDAQAARQELARLRNAEYSAGNK